MKYFIFLLLVIVLAPAALFAQENLRLLDKAKIEELNTKFASAFIKEELPALMKFFGADATSMPEYQPMLKGSSAIKAYYQEFFKRHDVKAFNKKVIELIRMKNNIAEIGSLKINLIRSSDGKALTLDGKYFNIWSPQKDGSMLLKAESYGYFHAVENPADLVVKTVGENNAKQVSSASKNLQFEMLALNTLMEKGVRERDGNLRADFFTDTAVFMPFADTSKSGMTEIRKHLIAYNSGTVTIDAIKIYSDYIEADGQYVIEYPKFDVKWRTPQISGAGQGKGIRIWRREPDHSLKLHREIGLHDHLD